MGKDGILEKVNRLMGNEQGIDCIEVGLSHIAQCIASQIYEQAGSPGLSVDELSSIVTNVCGKVNCYPGSNSSAGSCCDLAVFISLVSPAYRAGRGHMNFAQMLEKLVQHMQGHCFKITRSVLIITDNWEPAAFEAWKANIDQIKKTSDRIEA